MLNIEAIRNVFSVFISGRAEGPGREILQCPPSVCLSVTFSFRTVTRKRINVFSRNFAGTCTMSWGCAVDKMCFFFRKPILSHFISRFMLFSTLKKNWNSLVLIFYRDIDTSPRVEMGGGVSFWTCWREISGDRVALFYVLCSHLWLAEIDYSRQF